MTVARLLSLLLGALTLGFYVPLQLNGRAHGLFCLFSFKLGRSHCHESKISPWHIVRRVYLCEILGEGETLLSVLQ